MPAATGTRRQGCAVAGAVPLVRCAADGVIALARVVGRARSIRHGLGRGPTANWLAQEEVLELPRECWCQVRHRLCRGAWHGHAVGDPIEVGASAMVLCEGRTRADPLEVHRIRSVRISVDPEAAAGLAGSIKVGPALSRREISLDLNFKTAIPMIDWTASIWCPRHPRRGRTSKGPDSPASGRSASVDDAHAIPSGARRAPPGLL